MVNRLAKTGKPPVRADEIALPSGDVLMLRSLFATSILRIDPRTAQRMNLPTTYIGGAAYVQRDAALQQLADKVRRKNEPAKGRRHAR
jgi:hypothetical protein